MLKKVLNSITNIGITSILIIIILLGILSLSIMIIQTPRRTTAFPSAQGYGAFTTGGRGGDVYHVTTLEDTGNLGSLRYAVNQNGPRTIVFDISGIIELNSPLTIKKNDLTIAGQTAPGDGICIKNYPVTVDADNVIIRFVRFRLGDQSQGSSLIVKNRRDIIIDHCSMSWASNDNVTLYNNMNLTMQWSIISEALSKRNSNSGPGATLGGYSASYHHNLFASNRNNNPQFYRNNNPQNKLFFETADFRNNVLYNWGSSSIEGSDSGVYNIINNYYKFGPATQIASRSQIVDISNSTKRGFVYVSGNYVHTNPLQTNDNWMGVYPNTEYIKTSQNPRLTRFEFDHAPVTLHSAERAYDKVLKYAGVSNNPDFVDNRITQAVETYFLGAATPNGLISSPAEVGGYPEYKCNIPELDSDGDGIPDNWEFNHNLNPYDGGDGKSLTKSGYTNLEVYLNGLVENITREENKNPILNIDNIKLLIQNLANKLKKH